MHKISFTALKILAWVPLYLTAFCHPIIFFVANRFCSNFNWIFYGWLGVYTQNIGGSFGRILLQGSDYGYHHPLSYIAGLLRKINLLNKFVCLEEEQFFTGEFFTSSFNQLIFPVIWLMQYFPGIFFLINFSLLNFSLIHQLVFL